MTAGSMMRQLLTLNDQHEDDDFENDDDEENVIAGIEKRRRMAEHLIFLDEKPFNLYLFDNIIKKRYKIKLLCYLHEKTR